MSNRILGDEPNSKVAGGEQQRVKELAAYPLGRPACGGDARFTYGLALDVAAGTGWARLPAGATAADLVRLQHVVRADLRAE
jgi:hypothetical protein